MNTSTNFSYASSVEGERNELTKVVSISARPQITYVMPEFDLDPRSVVGFTQDFNFQGYGFNHVTSVFVSACPFGQGVYDHTTALSATTAFNLFAAVSGLSALYPAFTGRQLPDDDWMIANDNTMSITFSGCTGIGRADVIIVSDAGYGTLLGDLSGRTINVSA